MTAQQVISNSVLTYKGVVYPWQCDSMGHLATQHYIGFFDDATYHFLHWLGFDFSNVKSKQIGWADIKQITEYRHEVHAGDLFEISTTPLNISNKTIEYMHNVRNLNSSTYCTSMTVITAQFDLSKRKAIPLLGNIRLRFNELLDK